MCVIRDKVGYKHSKWHFLNTRRFSSRPAGQELGGPGSSCHICLDPLPSLCRQSHLHPQRQRHLPENERGLWSAQLCHRSLLGLLPSVAVGWRGAATFTSLCGRDALCTVGWPRCGPPRGAQGGGLGTGCPLPQQLHGGTRGGLCCLTCGAEDWQVSSQEVGGCPGGCPSRGPGTFIKKQLQPPGRVPEQTSAPVPDIRGSPAGCCLSVSPRSRRGPRSRLHNACHVLCFSSKMGACQPPWEPGGAPASTP